MSKAGGAHDPPTPAREERRTFADRIRTFGRRRESDRLRAFLGSAPGASLLDVGGGTGAFTSRFARDFRAVTVLEPIPRRVEQGRARRPWIEFAVGKGESIPAPPGSYARVTAIRSVHHMDSPAAFAAEAFRVLLPGGRLIVEEMTGRSLLGRLVMGPPGGPPRHGMHRLSPDMLVPLLRAAGFDPVVVETGRAWYFAIADRP